MRKEFSYKQHKKHLEMYCAKVSNHVNNNVCAITLKHLYI